MHLTTLSGFTGLVLIAFSSLVSSVPLETRQINTFVSPSYVRIPFTPRMMCGCLTWSRLTPDHRPLYAPTTPHHPSATMQSWVLRHPTATTKEISSLQSLHAHPAAHARDHRRHITVEVPPQHQAYPQQKIHRVSNLIVGRWHFLGSVSRMMAYQEAWINRCKGIVLVDHLTLCVRRIRLRARFSLLWMVRIVRVFAWRFVVASRRNWTV